MKRRIARNSKRSRIRRSRWWIDVLAICLVFSHQQALRWLQWIAESRRFKNRERLIDLCWLVVLSFTFPFNLNYSSLYSTSIELQDAKQFRSQSSYQTSVLATAPSPWYASLVYLPSSFPRRWHCRHQGQCKSSLGSKPQWCIGINFNDGLGLNFNDGFRALEGGGIHDGLEDSKFLENSRFFQIITMHSSSPLFQSIES